MTSKLTREQLHERARENVKALKMASRQTAFESAREEILADLQLAELALAAMDSEPVAEVLSNRPGNDTSTIDRALPVGTQLYRHAQPAPVVPEKCPAEIRDLISSHTDALFNDDDAQEIWNACRSAMLQASPVCTCPSGDGSLRWPCPVHPGNYPANPGCWCRTCRPVVLNDMRFVVCPDCGSKRCPRANDHRNACTGSNEPGQEGSAYPDTTQSPGSEPATVPGKWIPVSERMPEAEGHYLVWANASRIDGYCDHLAIAAYQGGQWSNEFNWLVNHWMPLPAAPQEVK